MSTLTLKSKRPRRKADFYETPIKFAKKAIDYLGWEINLSKCQLMLDPGAGNGIWGEALYAIKDEIFFPTVIGVELLEENHPNFSVYPDCDWYSQWWHMDYLDYNTGSDFDLVIGNPPFSLAEEFIRHSMELVKDGGYVYFLLRLAFLESKTRYRGNDLKLPPNGLFIEHPPKKVFVLVSRPSFFSSDSKTDTTDYKAYAQFLWQKGYKGETKLDWMDWK